MLPGRSVKHTAAVSLPWVSLTPAKRLPFWANKRSRTVLLHLFVAWIVSGHAEDEQVLRGAHGPVVSACVLPRL